MFMSSTVSRSEILRIFKALHKARKNTFKDDYERLTAMREGINEHFQNNKSETDQGKIKKLYDDAVIIENELRTKIIQVVEINPGYHKLNITPDHCVENPAVLYGKKKFKDERKPES